MQKPNERREIALRLDVTYEEKRMILQQAEALGLSMTELIVRAVNNFLLYQACLEDVQSAFDYLERRCKDLLYNLATYPAHQQRCAQHGFPINLATGRCVRCPPELVER